MLGLVLLSVATAEARPYRLMWDANSDGVTAGYRVYYGTAAGAYQPAQGTDVGNVEQFNVDLTPGQRYYFMVRAYDDSSVIGPPSTELSFTVPGDATISLNTASLPAGATLTATIASGPGNRLDWVGFFPSGAGGSASSATDWKYLNGSRTAPATGASSATVSFVAPNAPGNYDVRFYSNTNALLASSVPITVVGSASITALPSSLNVGQTITVAVSNGPANRFDMVALYPASSTNASGYLDWRFLNGSQTAPATGVANASVTFAAPTQAGQYRVRFLYNNSSTVLATSGIITVSNVTVAASVTPSVTTLGAGSNLSVQVANGPAGRFDWVALHRVGAPYSSFVAWSYLNGSHSAPGTGLSNANLQFTVPQQTGQYVLRFFANSGYTVLATSATINVTSASTPAPPPPTPPPSGNPAVTPSVASAPPGGNVTAQVTNGPAARLDWVALYPAGAGLTGFVDWFYLNGSKVAPSAGAPTANVVFRMPANLGQYSVRLLSNNSYTVLSTSSAITVTNSGNPAPPSPPVPPPTGTDPAITPSTTTVARGSVITVNIANGSGSMLDWVGVYRQGQSLSNFVDWTFLNGSKAAPATGPRNTSFSLRMPSTPGTYVLRFWANNGYGLLASSVNIVVQ